MDNKLYLLYLLMTPFMISKIPDSCKGLFTKLALVRLEACVQLQVSVQIAFLRELATTYLTIKSFILSMIFKLMLFIWFPSLEYLIAAINLAHIGCLTFPFIYRYLLNYSLSLSLLVHFFPYLFVIIAGFDFAPPFLSIEANISLLVPVVVSSWTLL